MGTNEKRGEGGRKLEFSGGGGWAGNVVGGGGEGEGKEDSAGGFWRWVFLVCG